MQSKNTNTVLGCKVKEEVQRDLRHTDKCSSDVKQKQAIG